MSLKPEIKTMLSTEELTLAPESVVGEQKKKYFAGTLAYTKWGLFALFVWMLWGDFCFNLLEIVLPRLLPLKLKGLGASNLLIGLLVGSIPGVMNLVITPIVSFKSDRYRSRWGRRIPFLFWPTPFIAVFLILLGYSDRLGGFLHRTVISGILSVFPTTTILITLGVLMISFQFFNMIVSSVYYYLFNDVVPERFLGQFMALFRMVGSGAVVVFDMFIFGKAETHMSEIFIGVGLLYLFSFLLMCRQVKEGDYPPAPQKIGRPGKLAGLKTFFIECFTHKFYIYFFLGTTLRTVSVACVMFTVFFAQSIGMNLDQFGKTNAWLRIPAIALLYPMGYLVDRIHPFRMVLLASILLVPVDMIYFWFVHDWTSYVMISFVALPMGVILNAATLPMYMTLLPKERYGQFCSAQALVNALGVIISTFLAGKFIDMVGDYRYIYVWSFVFHALGLVFMLMVYKEWLKHGGRKSYVPPSVNG